MNFITKLSKFKDLATEDSYDLILVMVDQLTKYSHIILFKKMYTAEQLRYIILNRLIRYHRISKELTSDWDKLFTLNYWKMLILILKIKLKMSTAYHPQTDDQTEWTNQSLKQYLQHYVNNAHDN